MREIPCANLIAMLGLLILFPSVSYAEPTDESERIFLDRCATCHVTNQVPKAIRRDAMAALPPEKIFDAITSGLMSLHAQSLDANKRKRLSMHLSAHPWTASSSGQLAETLVFCDNPAALKSSAWNGPLWSGWSPDLDNTREQPIAHAQLDEGKLADLELRWAFGFPGATTVGTQPAIVGDRLFIGSPEHAVYALHAKTGCAFWKYDTVGKIKGTPVVAVTAAGPTVFIGDRLGWVYALDADTGELRWKDKADEHTAASVTATLIVHADRVYVPVASLEETSGMAPDYECCTFRGSVVVYDALTGKRIWKTYLIAQTPSPTKRSPHGTQLFAPSGAAVWGTPTLDLKRGLLYVTTGDAYSRPAAKTTDAVVALELDTGAIRWSWQATPDDAYTNACLIADTHPQILEECGPDFDFGASAILRKLPSGADALLAGQKSGVLHGLNPDDGTLLWQKRLARGGILGGIEWGMSADHLTVYVPISDAWENADTPSAAGGIVAMHFHDQSIRWQRPAEKLKCLNRPGCNAGQPQAATLVGGLLFSGSMDGHMRVYRTVDGSVVWEHDTLRQYDTVNGVKGFGGSLNGAGTTVVDGWVYFSSGYGLLGMPGNVMLAFGPPTRRE